MKNEYDKLLKETYDLLDEKGKFLLCLKKNTKRGVFISTSEKFPYCLPVNCPWLQEDSLKKLLSVCNILMNESFTHIQRQDSFLPSEKIIILLTKNGSNSSS